MDNGTSQSPTGSVGLGRREFLMGAGAAALTFSIVNPGAVRGADGNSKIRLGMIGCGGRGRWIANLFAQHGGYEIVGASDYFADRVNGVAQDHSLPAGAAHTGLKGHERMLEACKPDAVAIITPPCFHPDQVEASVDAGAHVFLAKPMAVDTPGCLRIEAAAKRGAANGKCFLVDFQTRANDLYREAVKRAQAGDIGRMVCGESTYQASRLGIQAEPGTPEARLRNWVFDKALSGDIITEQNIHTLDVATWILDDAPVKAWGTGGRKARVDVGDCWDHFGVIFTFPDDIIINFNSTQFAKGWDTINCRVYGSRGTIDTTYGGEVVIKGDTPYRGGQTGGIYQEGAVRNIADFHTAIQAGDVSNPTLGPSVRSNLTTILGRMAAYTNSEVTWQQMLDANEELDLKLEGLEV